MKTVKLFFILLISWFWPHRAIAQFHADTHYMFEGIEYDIFDLVVTPQMLNRISLEENPSLESHSSFIHKLAGANSFFISTTSFEDNCKPVGWVQKNGANLNQVNSSTSGSGNFFIQPNGALVITSNDVQIVETSQISSIPDVRSGFQSGPMLVINGTINTTVNPNSKNLNYRSGVALYADKSNQNHLVFVVSRSPITFFSLARFLSTEFRAKVALALSSANCSMHIPYQPPSNPIQGPVSNCLYIKIDMP